MSVLFCDDGASGDGLTAAEAGCRHTVADALGRYARAKGICLYKCRRSEAKGKIDAGTCAGTAVTDGPTIACVDAARGDASARISSCADAPECAAPALPTILDLVDAGIDSLDGDVHCSLPTGCGDAFGLQCDGACPTGESCTNVSNQCVCAPSAMACGSEAGAPQCWGTCPPEQPVCHDDDGACECVNR